MTDLELKFQEVKKARMRYFNGVVLFDMLCNDYFTVQRSARCRSVESPHTVVLEVEGGIMYCVDRNGNTGFVYDYYKHEVVKVTTNEKVKDEVNELRENNDYEKVLARVERLKAELEKAEAILQKFKRD